MKLYDFHTRTLVEDPLQIKKKTRQQHMQIQVLFSNSINHQAYEAGGNVALVLSVRLSGGCPWIRL
jgi:hypothetical protein